MTPQEELIRHQQRCHDKKMIGGILVAALFAFIFLNPGAFFATILGLWIAPGMVQRHYEHQREAPPALTLQLSDYKWDGTYVQPLLTVENTSDKSYKWARWSCTFRDHEGNAVDEEDMSVPTIGPQGKTSKRSIARVRHYFDSISCRLTDYVRE
jgi:hypothetical protein